MKKTADNVDGLEQTVDSLRREIDILRKQLESQKLTKTQASEMKLAELIIDSSPAVLFRRLAAVNPEERKMVYVSPNISRFGYQADDFMQGRVMFRDIVYPNDTKRTLSEIEQFVKDGTEEYTQFYRIVTSNKEVRWVEDRTSIFEDISTGLRYHQGILIDIHEQREAEEKLRQSEEKFRRIVETTGEGFVLMDENFNVVDVNSAYANLLNSSREDLIGNQPLNLGEGVFRDLCFFGSESNLAEHKEVEFEMFVDGEGKVPVLIHANTLLSDRNEVIGNMAFITDMTVQKKALQLAAEVQKGLFPESAPLSDGLDIAGLSNPCDEVGGDYFDYLSNSATDSNDLSVVIGDISGHGVDSALFMASARAFLRMRASQPGSVQDIVMGMNKHLTVDMEKSSNFMTFYYLSINKSKKSLNWVRAGHDPALLYDPKIDEFSELKGPGIALGIDKNYPYQQQQLNDLESGQIIALTTDGIFEGCNKEGEMFGKERLKSIIRKNATETSDNILNQIIQKHSHFTKNTVIEDDITAVIIKFVD